MLSKLFGNDEPTKFDVVMHVGAALVAVYKAYDKYVAYKSLNTH